jgi:glutathione S-transferase|eukprot:g5295.t1
MRFSIVCFVACSLFAVGLATEATEEHPDPHITLRYFESRGRAEAVRILLEYLQVPYTDERYTSEQWRGGIKEEGTKSGMFAYGQLPALSYCHDGEKDSESCLHMTQSHTIMRFLDRWYGTYGPDEQRWLVDMLADGVEDFRSKYGKLVYSKDAQEKYADHFETEVPKWLGHFERMKSTHAEHTVFFTGDHPTHADLFLYTVLDLHTRLEPECLKDYPQLELFKQVVESIPSIEEYIKSGRRPKTPNGNSAYLDTPSNPAVEEEETDL